MAKPHIQVEYEQLDQVAGHFGSERVAIDQWRQKVRQTLADLPQWWKGVAADAFFTELQALEPNLDKLITALDTCSDQVRAVSKLFADAEEQVKSAASKRPAPHR